MQPPPVLQSPDQPVRRSLATSTSCFLWVYRPGGLFFLLDRPRIAQARSMVMMGQLGRLVDGIKSRLRAGGGSRRGGGSGSGSGSVSGRNKQASPAAAGYDKVEKTDSMRVEIRSRQARKLIAKNLDAIARSGARTPRNKRFLIAF